MAISPLKALFVGEAFYTAMAGVATKGVGSGFRAYDDRNAPTAVKKNTLKREAVTLGQVSIYTFLIDVAMQKMQLQAAEGLKTITTDMSKETVQKAANIRILTKAAPIALAIALAEAVGRVLAPRNIWDEDGQFNDEALESTDDDKNLDKKAFYDSANEDENDHNVRSKRFTPMARVKQLPLTFSQASPSQLTSAPKVAFPQALPASPMYSAPAANPFSAAGFSSPLTQTGRAAGF